MQRQYTHAKDVEKEMLELRAAGKTNRETAECFGFQDKYVVKEWVKRYNRRIRKIESGILPSRRGRPPKGMGNGKSTRYKRCANFSACPATDSMTTSSVWTSRPGMRRWRRRLPAVRSTAGRPMATGGYSYGLNGRESDATLKPYCVSCESTVCSLKSAAGKIPGYETAASPL